MRSSTRWASSTGWGAWFVAVCLAGCYGGVHGDGDDGGTAEDATDTGADTAADGGDDGVDTDGIPSGCDADTPPSAALLRMHRDNYVHALETVFGASALEPVRATIDTLPSASTGMFATEVPPVGFSEVSAYFNIASQLAFELTKDAASLTALHACLGSVPAGADAGADPCLVEFIDTFGTRLLRRPLTDDERSRFAGDYAVGGAHSVGEGVATVLVGMLLDPRFLYFVETDGEEIAPGVVALTSHELAARLARVLWDSVPDDELLAAAAGDVPLEGDALRAQIDRMLDDDRARVALSRFAANWLALDVVPQPSATLFPDAETREALRVAMKAELLEFIETTTLDRDGTYADLLLDRTASFESPELAEVYGVAPGADVTLPDDRAGLLTRAGWLATNEVIRSNAGHIIKRGRRLGEFLCRPVPPPDPGNFPTEDPADPATNPDAGIRERFDAAASEPQCAGCHRILDGYGAPFGHYGAAGQWIDVEQIDVDGGALDVPIDAASMLELDDVVAVDGARALSEAIATSDVGPQCLAEQLTRNIVARPLDASDGCLEQTARLALAPEDGAPQSLRDTIVALVSSPHFRQVTLP